MPNKREELRRSETEADDERRRDRAGAGLEYLAHEPPYDTGQVTADPFSRLVEGYKEMARSNTSNAETHLQFGRQFLQVKMWDWAITAFKRALELAPQWADAQYYYASALNSAGRTEEALIEYKKARELDPTMLEARFESELLKIKTSSDEKEQSAE